MIFLLTQIFISDEDLDNKIGFKLKVELKDDEEDTDSASTDVLNSFTLARDYKYDKEHRQWCQLQFAVSGII